MPTKAEIAAVREILEDPRDDLTIEEVTGLIIEALDTARAEKITYAAVMQMSTSDPWYLGLGYYPGEKSARNAIEKHPAAGMAKAIATVPVRSPKGLALLLAETDRKAELSSADLKLVAEDAKLYKLGWNGKSKDRKLYLDMLNNAA